MDVCFYTDCLNIDTVAVLLGVILVSAIFITRTTSVIIISPLFGILSVSSVS